MKLVLITGLTIGLLSSCGQNSFMSTYLKRGLVVKNSLSISCLPATRTITSAANNVGATQSCVATLPSANPGTNPVSATVTNGGGYSLVCQNSGDWAASPASSSCPTPAAVTCAGTSRTITSAANNVGATQTCVATLPSANPGTNPVSATVTNGGGYSLVCQNSGDWAASPASFSCPTPAAVTAAILWTTSPAIDSNIVYNADKSLTFSVQPAGVGATKCFIKNLAVAGSAPTAMNCASATSLLANAEGNYEYSVQVVSDSGIRLGASSGVQVQLDKQAPKISFTATEAGNSADFKFGLSSSENISYVVVRLDEVIFWNSAPPPGFVFSGQVKEGNHRAQFQAFDYAGNGSNVLTYDWRYIRTLDLNFTDQQLRADRNLVKDVYPKSCYCIECSVDETRKAIDLGCKAIQWGSFPWVEFSNILGPYTGGTPTSVRAEFEKYFADLKQRTFVAEQAGAIYEGGITEIVSDQVTLLALTDAEIDLLNLLTDKFTAGRVAPLDKSNDKDRKIFSDFSKLVSLSDPRDSHAEIFRWWGDDGEFSGKKYKFNGRPNLENREGWYYHLWLAVRGIQAGVGGLKITQVNFRFHEGNGYGNKQSRTQVLVQFFKATRAYKMALSGKPLVISTESLYDYTFFASQILPYVDYVKFMADVDLAHAGSVLTMDPSQNRSCLQKNYAPGTISDVSDFRTGPLCLVDNSDQLRVRTWTGEPGNPNFLVFATPNYDVPFSVELDGCQTSFARYKTVGKEFGTVWSSRIRNGLAVTQQFIGQPPEVRRELIKYMNKTTRQLSEKYGRTIFSSQLVKIDQNLTEDASRRYLPEEGAQTQQYQDARVRYCPSSLTDDGIRKKSDYYYQGIYFAEECGDQITMKSVLNNSAYQIRSAATFVLQIYPLFFGRAPDSGGLQYWSGQCRSGSIASVITQMTTSEDALTRNLTRVQFAAALYQLILNRTDDAGAQSAALWESSLSEVAWRSAIIQYFSQSEEFRKGHLILGCEL